MPGYGLPQDQATAVTLGEQYSQAGAMGWTPGVAASASPGTFRALGANPENGVEGTYCLVSRRSSRNGHSLPRWETDGSVTTTSFRHSKPVQRVGPAYKWSHGQAVWSLPAQPLHLYSRDDNTRCFTVVVKIKETIMRKVFIIGRTSER